MSTDGLISSDARILTKAEFQGLSEIPPELEWFADIDNPDTRAAYQEDVWDFIRFIGGVERPEEIRMVTSAHVVAWRKALQKLRYHQSPCSYPQPAQKDMQAEEGEQREFEAGA